MVKLNTVGMSAEQSLEISERLKTFLNVQFKGSCEVKDEHKVMGSNPNIKEMPQV